MVRSSAKNYNGVAIVTDPADYAPLLAEMQANGGELALATRFGLAKKAFTHTAAVTTACHRQLADRPGRRRRSQAGRSRPDPVGIPGQAATGFRPRPSEILRYGENSHQQAAFYRDTVALPGSIAAYTQLQGKELSYNNIADSDAAWECVKSFDRPGLRHRQARQPVRRRHRRQDCLAPTEKAFQTDSGPPPSAASSPSTAKSASRRCRGHERPQALRRGADRARPSPPKRCEAALAAKANLRVLVWCRSAMTSTSWNEKRVGGGLLVQTADDFTAQAGGLKVVTKRAADRAADAKTCSSPSAWPSSSSRTPSSSASGGMTLGVGAGQMSRVDSTKHRLASRRRTPASACKGSVVASDAFFPFRDGVDVLAEAGAVAIIQPGGSDARRRSDRRRRRTRHRHGVHRHPALPPLNAAHKMILPSACAALPYRRVLICGGASLAGPLRFIL